MAPQAYRASRGSTSVGRMSSVVDRARRRSCIDVANEPGDDDTACGSVE